MLKHSVRIFALLLPLSTAPAQVTHQEDHGKPEGVTFGIKGKLAYAPNPWRTTLYQNLPESLRTVTFSGGSTYTFAQDQLKLHSSAFIVPMELGPSLNFGNRLEVSFGGALSFNNDISNRMQLGCYCIGSTVTFIQFEPFPVSFGGFGDFSIRLKKDTWFTAEAISYPVATNVSLRHGFSAYNSDDTLFKKAVATYRTPLTLLAGMKFTDQYKDESFAFGFSGGMAFRQNQLTPIGAGIRVPQNQQFLIFQVFVEFNEFFEKKPKH